MSTVLIKENIFILQHLSYCLLIYFSVKSALLKKTCPNFRIIFKMSVNEEWSTVTALVPPTNFPHEPRLRSCTQGSLLALAPKENHTQNLHECLYRLLVSAPCSRQITTPAPHHSVFFTGPMPFLPPNQQRQSTEGNRITQSRHCVGV